MDFLSFVRNQWDRVSAWVAIALGVVVLFLGWLGVSGSVLVSEQMPYLITGGLGGFFLLGLGAMLWLSADLRDEWRKLDDLDRRWSEVAAASAAQAATPVASNEHANGSVAAAAKRPRKAAAGRKPADAE